MYVCRCYMYFFKYTYTYIHTYIHTLPDASPKCGPYWSLMFEISESKEYKPVNYDTIVEVSFLIHTTYSTYIHNT